MAGAAVVLSLIWTIPLVMVAGLVSGAGRGRQSLLGLALTGRWIEGGLTALRAYGQAGSVPPSRWRVQLASALLLAGGPGVACLFIPMAEGGLAGVMVALLVCMWPVRCTRRMWASTPGEDTILDQALTDARAAETAELPLLGRIPIKGGALVSGAFVVSTLLLLIFSGAGMPFAPVPAALPLAVVLAPHLPLSVQRRRVRHSIEGAVHGVAGWPTDAVPPTEVGFVPGTDQVKQVWVALPPAYMTSKDEGTAADLRARLGGLFRVEFDHAGRIMQATASSTELPQMVELGPDWPPEGLRLRLGMWLNEQEEPEWAVWDPSTADPHCLVAGRPGRGKSVTLRVLLSQGLAAGWQIVIADPKGVDFRWTEDLPGVKWSGGDDAPEAIDAAHAEMEMRQQWMRDNAERTATDLMEVPDQPFQPMLVIADEAAELAGLGDKKRQERTKDKLGSLVRRGRFIGAMVCVATQRPDATFIPGEAKANLGTRVLCGEGDSQMYAMALESSPEEVPALSPPHRRGQGRVRIGGQPAREIQLAFVSPQAVLDAQQAAWPQKKHQDGAPLLVPPEWTQDNGAVPHDEGEEET